MVYKLFLNLKHTEFSNKSLNLINSWAFRNMNAHFYVNLNVVFFLPE